LVEVTTQPDMVDYLTTKASTFKSLSCTIGISNQFLPLTA